MATAKTVKELSDQDIANQLELLQTEQARRETEQAEFRDKVAVELHKTLLPLLPSLILLVHEHEGSCSDDRMTGDFIDTNTGRPRCMRCFLRHERKKLDRFDPVAPEALLTFGVIARET